MFDDYPPLELLKTVETRVPCGCEMMEDIHCANGQEDMDSWPEWCYAPLAAAVCVALFEGDLGCKNPEEIMEWAFSLGEKLFAVAPWKRRKTVDMVEPALVDYVLKNRVVLARVPSMDLVHLPCASFYLQVDFLGTDKYPVHGAFVTLECDPGTERKECRVLFLYNDDTWSSYALEMGERSVFGAIQAVLDERQEQANRLRAAGEACEFGEEHYCQVRKQLEGTMQLAFFLCLLEHYKEDGALAAVTRIKPVNGMDICYVRKPEDPALRCMKAFAC